MKQIARKMNETERIRRVWEGSVGGGGQSTVGTKVAHEEIMGYS